MVSNIKIIKINSEISSILINEPKTYNSLSLKNLTDLLKALKKLDADNNVKVIIIEGAGKGFSAGHNLKEVRRLKKKDKYQKLFNLCSKVMLQIVEGKKPVIAKVHGAAFAAGCQLVASCDLAYSTKDALFATPGVNIGLFCSTPMVAVSRKINRKPMMKMLLTGEPIKANYAKEIGLINDYFSKQKLNREVLSIAKKIASKSGGLLIALTFGSSNPVEELNSLTCVFGSLGFNARQGTTYSIEMKKGELRFFLILFYY